MFRVGLRFDSFLPSFLPFLPSLSPSLSPSLPSFLPLLPLFLNPKTNKQRAKRFSLPSPETCLDWVSVLFLYSDRLCWRCWRFCCVQRAVQVPAACIGVERSFLLASECFIESRFGYRRLPSNSFEVVHSCHVSCFHRSLKPATQQISKLNRVVLAALHCIPHR